MSESIERRKAIAEDLLRRGVMERRSMDTGPLEVRSTDDGKLHVSGYASVFGRPYEVGKTTEVVRRGAFSKTLNDNAQVHLLINHSGLPLASTTNGTLQLREDHVGLRFDAALDPDDADSQSAVRKIKSGLLRECSFAFMPIRQKWSDDYSTRELIEVSINKGDVSVVNFGASSHTSLTARAAALVAHADACNRCGGEGAISLNGRDVLCPQCKGTGGPDGNADGESGVEALSLGRSNDARARLALARARAGTPPRPPRGAMPNHSAQARLALARVRAR